VFVFYLFQAPPVLFQPNAMREISGQAEFSGVQRKFDSAFEQRRAAARAIGHAGDPASRRLHVGEFKAAQQQLNGARQQAIALFEKAEGKKGFNDNNYVFLTFVTTYLPAGVVGLIIAVIFAAAMSASSGEVNSLATVTVIDIYKRHVRKQASDRHYLMASRLATAFWGLYAVAFAQYGKNLGSLVEAVNLVGSFFYGSLLGVFTLAFGFRSVGGTAAFWGMAVGEAAILLVARFTAISYLWYNVIGAVVVIVTGLLLSRPFPNLRNQDALDQQGGNVHG